MNEIIGTYGGLGSYTRHTQTHDERMRKIADAADKLPAAPCDTCPLTYNCSTKLEACYGFWLYQKDPQDGFGQHTWSKDNLQYLREHPYTPTRSVYNKIFEV